MNRLWAWTGAGGLLVGLLLGWWIGMPVALPPEPPAPSVRQADGSLVIERVDPKTQPAKPPHAIPKGANEMRRVSVVVQPPKGTIKQSLQVEPKPDHIPQPGRMADLCDCPSVTVDLSLVRMPDKSRRVVASSPTGQILSGVDVPIELESVPSIPRWMLSAIAVGDLDGIRPGALLSRRIGPFVAGGGFISDPGLRRPGAIVHLGVNW